MAMLELKGREWRMIAGPWDSSLSLVCRTAPAEEGISTWGSAHCFVSTQNSFPSSQRCLIFLSGHCVFCAGGMRPYSCHCLLTTQQPLLPSVHSYFSSHCCHLLSSCCKNYLGTGSIGDFASYERNFTWQACSRIQARGHLKVIIRSHVEHGFQCSFVGMSFFWFFGLLQPIIFYFPTINQHSGITSGTVMSPRSPHTNLFPSCFQSDLV